MRPILNHFSLLMRLLSVCLLLTGASSCSTSQSALSQEANQVRAKETSASTMLADIAWPTDSVHIASLAKVRQAISHYQLNESTAVVLLHLQKLHAKQLLTDERYEKMWRYTVDKKLTSWAALQEYESRQQG